MEFQLEALPKPDDNASSSTVDTEVGLHHSVTSWHEYSVDDVHNSESDMYCSRPIPGLEHLTAAKRRCVNRAICRNRGTVIWPCRCNRCPANWMFSGWTCHQWPYPPQFRRPPADPRTGRCERCGGQPWEWQGPNDPPTGVVRCRGPCERQVGLTCPACCLASKHYNLCKECLWSTELLPCQIQIL